MTIFLNDVFVYEYSKDATKECCKLSGLKQQKCIPSQLRRLEVHNQGAGRTRLSLRISGKNLFHHFHTFWCCQQSLVFFALQLYNSSFLLSNSVLPLCWFFFSSYKDTNHIRSKAHPTPILPDLN